MEVELGEVLQVLPFVRLANDGLEVMQMLIDREHGHHRPAFLARAFQKPRGERVDRAGRDRIEELYLHQLREQIKRSLGVILGGGAFRREHVVLVLFPKRRPCDTFVLPIWSNTTCTWASC